MKNDIHESLSAYIVDGSRCIETVTLFFFQRWKLFNASSPSHIQHDQMHGILGAMIVVLSTTVLRRSIVVLCLEKQLHWLKMKRLFSTPAKFTKSDTQCTQQKHTLWIPRKSLRNFSNLTYRFGRKKVPIQRITMSARHAEQNHISILTPPTFLIGGECLLRVNGELAWLKSMVIIIEPYIRYGNGFLSGHTDYFLVPGITRWGG